MKANFFKEILLFEIKGKLSQAGTQIWTKIKGAKSISINFRGICNRRSWTTRVAN